MGAKVQFDGYYSMRDRNQDSSSPSWPLYCGETNLPNGQYYYSVLPRPSPDLFPGGDKDLLKQKMLEHEAVFKDQVFELHRVYRVQKNLMDEIRKKEQYKQRSYETSSSSSPFPSQMTPEDAKRQTSSSFLFTNSVCGGPPVSDPEFIQSSAGGSLKGNSIQGGPVPFHNSASPKNSEVSESRPTKLRKMFDLQLPAEEYMDTDEVEQCRNGMAFHSGGKLFPRHCENIKYQEIGSKSDSFLRKPNALADLNEPLESEETTANPSVNFSGVQNQDLLTKVPGLSEDVSCKPTRGTQNNSYHNDKGNRHNWFSSVLKAEGTKDQGKSIHQTNQSEKLSLGSRPVQVMFENSHEPHGKFRPPHVKEDPWPAKANDGLKMFDNGSLSSVNNPGGFMASHLPSYASSSNLANSWDLSWGKPSNHLSQSSSAQTTPFLNSASLSKSTQSAAQSNDFMGTWWHRHSDPRSNPRFGSETPVQNGFYHGFPSGGCKESPAHFSKPGLHYANDSYNDKVASGSNNFLKGKNSLDLNSTRDLNLNVALPNGLSDELLVQQGHVKREDPVSVLPWLRGKASSHDASSLRNSPNKPESGLFDDPRELCNRSEVRNALDHPNSVTSTSCNADATRRKDNVISNHSSSAKKILGVPIIQTPLSGEQEIDSGKKKVLLDINMPCEDLEEFGNADAKSEVIFVEEKIETEHSNGLRHMIDLNSCLTEDEIPSRTSLTNSSTNANSMKKPERGIIDLEAPIDLEAEEEGNCVQDEELSLNQHQLPLHSSLHNSTDSSDKELARVAAEAIVTISSSTAENHVDAIVKPLPAEQTSDSGDALSWFVDIVCACPDSVESHIGDNAGCLSSESDYFEEMTLKLTECTVEEYFPNPPKFDIQTVEETVPTNLTGRPRRGPTRRGRQRRDFQRDILPGLASLARHEVTEDLQTFGGLMRATGHAWHCGSRRNSSRNGSGRGRRRKVEATPPPPPPPPPAAVSPAENATTFASPKHLLKNGEIILEDRSLTSWGKTTRRPRRQRCPPAAGNPAPIPLT